MVTAAVIIAVIAVFSLLNILLGSSAPVPGARPLADRWCTAGRCGSLESLVNNPDGEWSVHTTLPKVLGSDCLIFKTDHIYLDVSVDGRLIYSYNESSLPAAASPANAWHFIELPPESSDKELSISYTPALRFGNKGISQLYLCEPGHFIKAFTDQKLLSFMLCAGIFFYGLVLVATDLLLMQKLRGERSFVMLGLFSMCIALWSTMQTQLPYLFFGNSFIVQFFEYASLSAAMGFMTLFISRVAYLKKYSLPLRLSAYAAFLIVAVQTLLDATHTLAFTQTLVVTHAFMLAWIAALAFIFVKDRLFRYLTGASSMVCTSLGIPALFALALTDLVRYSGKAAGADFSEYTRLGLTIFIVCVTFDYASVMMSYMRMVLSTQSMTEKAYTDGLTGLRNQFAFIERLAALEKEPRDGVGFVQLDINDLKLTNDRLGHWAGDALLRSSANIISGSFSQYAECFRTGGDEFVVVLTSDCEKRFAACFEQFTQEIDSTNERLDSPVGISIACGFARFESEKDSLLSDTLRRADELMYENKRRMKQTPVR